MSFNALDSSFEDAYNAGMTTAYFAARNPDNLAIASNYGERTFAEFILSQGGYHDGVMPEQTEVGCHVEGSTTEPWSGGEAIPEDFAKDDDARHRVMRIRSCLSN